MENKMSYSEMTQLVIEYMDRYPVENETDFNMFAVDFAELFCLICTDIANEKGWDFEGI